MMIRNKRVSWTFTIVTKKGMYQFVLKDLYIFIILALAILFFLSSSFLTFKGAKKLSLYSEFRNQQKIKKNYLSSLKKIGDEIGNLNKQITLYSVFDDKLRYAVDVSPLERELRVKGVGGPRALDTLRAKLSKSSYGVVSDLVSEVGFTEKLVELETTSYEEIYRRLASTIDLKRHTPSIWPTNGYISSGFGWRIHPIRRTPEFHNGIDIANLPGTHIYAPADGIVDFTGRLGGFGKYLSIDHGYGFKTKYGHLQRILVREGQKVKRGDLIAIMGRSGYVTGPHLHYEVRVLNRAVNPLSYIVRDTLTY